MSNEIAPARIAILAFPEITASVVYGMYDLFKSAGRDWGIIVSGQPGGELIQPIVVSRHDSGFIAASDASEDLFRKLFRKHSSIMLLIDPANGIIADANLAAAAFYRYDEDVLRGMKISEINTQPEGQFSDITRKRETDEQRLLLQQSKCDFGQGYLFSRPIVGAAFEQFLSAHHSP